MVSNQLVNSSQTAVQESQEASHSSATERGSRFLQVMKSVYQADQQAKFLDLHAEADSLLQQLQQLKQQRELSASGVTANQSSH